MSIKYTEDHEWIKVEGDIATVGSELFAIVRGKPVPMVVSITPFVRTRYHRG